MMTQVTAHVLDVIRKNLLIQNDKGFRKYGETLDDVPFENYDWNQMVMEEMSDAMHYLMMENMKLKQQLEELRGMKFVDYQEMSKRTMPKMIDEHHVKFYSNDSKSNYALGLNGEAGELGDLVKKNVHHGHAFDRDKFVKEAGDVLHYLAGICTMYDVTLDEVATINIHKLHNRYPNGFNTEDSIRRKDNEYDGNNLG